MTFNQKAEGIKTGAKQAYEFIQVCYQKGLCTYEEANKAMDSVHKDAIRDLEIAAMSKKQFMLDRKMEAGI